MHAKTLKNWRGRRAGGRITVYGENATTGTPEKIVGVDEIKPSPQPGVNHVIAVDKDGITHYLKL